MPPHSAPKYQSRRVYDEEAAEWLELPMPDRKPTVEDLYIQIRIMRHRSHALSDAWQSLKFRTNFNSAWLVGLSAVVIAILGVVR